MTFFFNFANIEFSAIWNFGGKERKYKCCQPIECQRQAVFFSTLLAKGNVTLYNSNYCNYELNQRHICYNFPNHLSVYPITIFQCNLIKKIHTSFQISFTYCLPTYCIHYCDRIKYATMLE